MKQTQIERENQSETLKIRELLTNRNTENKEKEEQLKKLTQGFEVKNKELLKRLIDRKTDFFINALYLFLIEKNSQQRNPWNKQA